MNREDHTQDFMRFVMTPPKQEQAKYDMYKPVMSEMRIVSSNDSRGLGELPVVSGGESRQDWVMPVVVIVVSAMALMTLYAVLSKR